MTQPPPNAEARHKNVDPESQGGAEREQEADTWSSTEGGAATLRNLELQLQHTPSFRCLFGRMLVGPGGA
jgi:hypothetical protein